jgi:hypothetical protein
LAPILTEERGEDHSGGSLEGSFHRRERYSSWEIVEVPEKIIDTAAEPRQEKDSASDSNSKGDEKTKTAAAK